MIDGCEAGVRGVDRLHPALVHHIANSLGWPRLRPLQEAAIDPLLDGAHVILVAPTAGGKTEAAFFPVLSRMLTEDWRGMSVLYLCPLRALLNNLHDRLEGYGRLVGRSVGLWHGDVGDSERRRLLQNPPDVLLTTPESLEAMLISTRVDHADWFANLRTVVIDEAHAFGSDDRGWHLSAVLERVSRLAERELQRVALSATVGNPAELLDWLTSTCKGVRKVVEPPPEPGPAVEIALDFVGSLDNAALVISRLHRGEKRLVFVDSRARAEQLTAALRARDVRTFISHGSLARDERRRTEAAFSTERDAVVVATSTLELGIDIGDLDRVIQIDAPNTVASLLQRLGRTGRRPGTTRNTLFLATDDDALLRSAGLLLRWSEGHVEPVIPPVFPLHLLAQQALAIVLQEGGVGRRTWVQWLGTPCVFGPEVAACADEVTDHLVDEGYLVDDGGLLGVGPKAESDLGRRHFLELMAVFTSPPLFTILEGRREIGQISATAVQVTAGGSLRPFLLAGRTWQVLQVDWRSRIVHAEAVIGHGVARWEGSGAVLDVGIARAVRSVLSGADPPDVQLSRRTVERLTSLRADRSWTREGATTLRRGDAGHAHWWTFAGDQANWWLAGALDRYRCSAPAPDSYRIALDPDTPLAEVRAHLACVDATDLQLGVTISADAVTALKFAELLPEARAREIVLRRLDARRAAMDTLAEPVDTAT